MDSSRGWKRLVGKKFVISCDGTWENSDLESDDTPTNATRVIRSLKHFDDAGIPQIAYYQRGAGSDGNLEDKVIGGFTGNDVSEHVREAYAMIANNFNPETQADVDNPNNPMDEIVLLGFSRGAFTARAIASLISDVGLLTKIGMESFWEIFGDWKNQDMPGQESSWFQKTYGKKVLFTDPEYRETLMRDKLTRWGMPIRAIGVWDTVGALGIPMKWSKKVKEFSFVNTKVARHVEHAFHAMALDEHRNLFTPTLWELPDTSQHLKILKQCWFPGVHSNIGGSYVDAGIANITLAWMISQLEDNDGGILSFDPNYLDWVQDQNNKGYASRHEAVRPWGMGRLYDSASPNTALGIAQGINPITRTPGRYFRIDTQTGKPTNQPLTNTNEYIHRCVRVRIDAGGLSTEEDPETATAKVFNGAKKIFGLHPERQGPPGVYNPPALSNYELTQSRAVQVEVDHSIPGPSDVLWRAKDGGKDLHEDQLGYTEIRLLRRSVATAQGSGGRL